MHRYLYAYANPTVYVDLNGYEATPWFHWTVNEETDVLETRGQTYDTGSDLKDAFYATSDTISNFGKVAFNDVMAITASPEYAWAKTKGAVKGRSVSLHEATGDFDATIGALPILQTARPSNVPRVLRKLLGKKTRQVVRIVENGRGPLKAAGEIDDLPPMPKEAAVRRSIGENGSPAPVGQGQDVSNSLDNLAAPGPVNFMADSDRFFINASKRNDIDPEGYYDVVAHGSPHKIQIETPNGGVLVNHRTAAKLIQQQPDYNGQNIRLFSCSTGACDKGFAQNLANKLNVEVQAPTDLLWAYPDGKTLVAPKALNGQPNINNIGEIKSFLPEKSR